jgi:hypothetical protein
MEGGEIHDVTSPAPPLPASAPERQPERAPPAISVIIPILDEEENIRPLYEGCHPAEGEDFSSTYLCERAEELTVLCHPRVRATLAAEGIELTSFDRHWTPDRPNPCTDGDHVSSEVVER